MSNWQMSVLLAAIYLSPVPGSGWGANMVMGVLFLFASVVSAIVEES